ncbi:MAG: hypothetical protein F4Y86_17210 [Gammaproteobacteria bacterium]|nr:hypothetical protein [Gammaproteobacteria bacterium]
MTFKQTRPKDVRARRWRHAPATLVLVASGAFAADGGMAVEATNPFAQFSDEQLSDLGGRWEAMDDEERRWYFVEMRKRMAANGEPTRIPVSSRARFGRILEDASAVLGIDALELYDGELGLDAAPSAPRPPIRAGLKTPVLEAAPHADAGEPATREGFGTGFEHRSTEPESKQESADATSEVAADGERDARQS